MSIPETASRGDDVAFNCSFNLQGESLYAVKWYRGNYEILRYTPSGRPRIKTFPLEGFANVDPARSSNTTLFIGKVDFANSGAYSCEVIADGSFHTLIETREMLVIDLPDKQPSITGVNASYKAGDRIKATCTSWNGRPPANLTWFINAEPVNILSFKKDVMSLMMCLIFRPGSRT